jgi:amidophosphoribosyltransferase
LKVICSHEPDIFLIAYCIFYFIWGGAALVHENCGVIAIFSLDKHNVIPFAIDSLRALQHRGQEAWGIAVPGRPPFRKLGLVSSAASDFPRVVSKYKSHTVIGHVR